MKCSMSRCLALASVVAAGVVAGAARPQYGGTLCAEIDGVVGSLDPAAAASDAQQEDARARISTLAFETLTESMLFPVCAKT